MATTQELAVLAIDAYEFRRPEDNQMPAPEGWTRVANVAPMGGNLSHGTGTFENLNQRGQHRNFFSIPEN